MKELLVCNYAVVRFLPYPETQEFVNLGVVLACPAIGLFDYRLTTRRRDRVTGFFPELDGAVFIQGRREFAQELARLKRFAAGQVQPGQMEMPFARKQFANFFAEVVRQRESLFRFGPMSTVMTADPAAELERLYKYFVERQFAQHEDYQETVMANRLADTLRARDIQGYHQEKLGDDLYHVTLPFVRHTGDGPANLRAIKPLDLAKKEPTRIIEHGDRWVARMRRLGEMHYDPAAFLFPVSMPTERRKTAAADQVLADLNELKVEIIPFRETDRIIRFAAA